MYNINLRVYTLIYTPPPIKIDGGCDVKRGYSTELQCSIVQTGVLKVLAVRLLLQRSFYKATLRYTFHRLNFDAIKHISTIYF